MAFPTRVNTLWGNHKKAPCTLQALRNLMPGGKEIVPPPLQQPAASGGTACHMLGIGHGVHRGFLDGK